MVKTSAKGQVVIPADLRQRIGLRPGARVLVTLAGERKVAVEPVPDDPIEAACGMLRGGPALTDALAKERKGEHAREERNSARFVRPADLPQPRRRLRKG